MVVDAGCLGVSLATLDGAFAVSLQASSLNGDAVFFFRYCCCVSRLVLDDDAP